MADNTEYYLTTKYLRIYVVPQNFASLHSDNTLYVPAEHRLKLDSVPMDGIFDCFLDGGEGEVGGDFCGFVGGDSVHQRARKSRRENVARAGDVFFQFDVRIVETPVLGIHPDAGLALAEAHAILLLV